MNTHLNERRKALLDSYKEQGFEDFKWFSEVENCESLLNEKFDKDIFVEGIYKDALYIEFGKISTLLQNLSEDKQIEKICELANPHIQDKQKFEMRMYSATHPLCEIIPKFKRVLLEIRDIFSTDSTMRCVLEKFIQIRQEIQNSIKGQK